METLRRYMFDKGVLAITIRPKEYWHIHNGGANARAMIDTHDEEGFAFVPHKRDPIDGEIFNVASLFGEYGSPMESSTGGI